MPEHCVVSAHVDPAPGNTQLSDAPSHFAPQLPAVLKLQNFGDEPAGTG